METNNIEELYNRDYYEHYPNPTSGSYLKARRILGILLVLLLKSFVDKPVKKVLDVGCALGIAVQQLRLLGYDAHGIDFSQAAIDMRVCDEVEVGDVRKIQFPDEAFDLIVSFETMEHVPEEDIPQVISELHRVTRKYVFLTVCFSGGEGHLCVQNRSWWEENLLSKFNYMEGTPQRLEVNSKVGWNTFFLEKK